MDYAVESTYAPALQNIKHSIYAHQVFCSIFEEMLQTPVGEKMSNQSNIYTSLAASSYYRDLAAGSLTRLHYATTDPVHYTPLLLQMTVMAIYVARGADRAISTFLPQVSEGKQYSEWQTLLQEWQRQRVHWLRETAVALRQFTPPDVWAKGKNMASMR
ncbi:hypothetical protein ACOJUR_08980 [Alicyclobacillus tolerans]|uniref:Uncharacterized protein n=2 Tax=Alicyclobacillus tolerans TaxID=90970 RepID=A0A1M6MD26_9BACL|nr:MULTISPECIES: hypothetical protein [Alicyclobacillus]MDP9728249.1 hypothetical protein [Alicyclobacillus tengchongensis]QRF23461.1 hypothetical protein FY534_07125 [Alicyclobacillus sp. TC]SHJ81355.1 hypothetical protein SAMN05443507_10415 [Alicyclobacillus montanus]